MVRRAVIAVLLLAGPAWGCPGLGETRFPQPVAVGALIGRVAQQPVESQVALGTVRSVAREADGCLVAIMDRSGWFGFGSRLVAVPLGAMTLLGNAMEVVDLSPAALDAVPTYTGGAVALPPETVVRVGLSRPAH